MHAVTLHYARQCVDTEVPHFIVTNDISNSTSPSKLTESQNAGEFLSRKSLGGRPASEYRGGRPDRKYRIACLVGNEYNPDMRYVIDRGMTTCARCRRVLGLGPIDTNPS